MRDILYCEWLKLKRSKMVFIGVSGSLIVPLLVLFSSVQRYLKNPENTIDLFGLYDSAIMFLMLLFGPLVMSVIAVYLINREYSEKTLKTVFAVPVSRIRFLAGKFLMLLMLVMLFMLMSWLHILVLAIICSLFLETYQITVISAAFFLIRMLSGGILLYMTITPVIFLGIQSKSFIIPLMAAIVTCLLNVILSNSSIAGFFPWSASYLLANKRSGNFGCPPSVSLIIIVSVFFLSVAGSIRSFMKQEY